MRVKIWPDFGKEVGQGGIKRVNEALHRWLPEYGIEIVDRIEEADVVNVHADWIKTDKPVAYSNHGLYWSGYEWPRWALDANAKLVHATRYTHALSVPSQFVHNVFARGMRLDPFVLMHGVELEEWEPPDEHYNYIFWGKTRVDPICSAEPLNKLAELCPELSFVSTFGDSNLSNMTLTGHMTYERSREVLRQASVYLASTKETGGITVLEALASGIPALGFAHGVNTEIIRHQETGFLAAVGDYAALREGLYYILENRERLGDNAREFVRNGHQWRDRIGDYLPFFEAAIAGAKPHTGPEVSVIVTAYNLDKYLPACLDSILSQDFDSWECIIVNDNSPDRCGEIANAYARKDARFKVIHNSQNVYLSEARNIGIRVSTGKKLLPLDADDELGVGALRVLSEALDQDRAIDVAFGGFELIEPDGKHWLSTWPPDNPAYDQQIRMHNQLPYSSMYRREWWERVGGYKRRWKSAEDAAFWTEIMSYGAVPAKVTDRPTLVYNNRPASMSHSIPTPDWTAWCTWSRFPELTPFGASGVPENGVPVRPIADYDPPQISVVIPVGPRHDQYLPDALDSLVAQTHQNWEVIVVNDTGVTWFDDSGNLINPYLSGYAFAKLLDCEHEGKSVGPARSRNRGIRLAQAKAFVLLDADDYFQPLALELMLKAFTVYGGWIYTDFIDQEGNGKESQDFIWDNALIKMPGPITGIYSKADWELVGGFDEKIIFWEDYSYLLSLMEYNRCGVRLRYPAFTYRYDLGNRREWTHTNAEKALAELKKKHKDLFEGKCKETP